MWTYALWVVLDSRRKNDTRRDGVDANAIPAPFPRQGARKVVNASAGGTGVRHARETVEVVGDDIYNRNTGPLLRRRQVVQCLAHRPGAREIRLDDGLPALHADVLRRTGELPTAVVDEDIDP